LQNVSLAIEVVHDYLTKLIGAFGHFKLMHMLDDMDYSYLNHQGFDSNCPSLMDHSAAAGHHGGYSTMASMANCQLPPGAYSDLSCNNMGYGRTAAAAYSAAAAGMNMRHFNTSPVSGAAAAVAQAMGAAGGQCGMARGPGGQEHQLGAARGPPMFSAAMNLQSKRSILLAFIGFLAGTTLCVIE
jgi:hypothetical protein